MIPGISHLMARQLHHFSTSHPIIALLVHSSAVFSPKMQLCVFSMCLCLFFVKAKGKKTATKESRYPEGVVAFATSSSGPFTGSGQQICNGSKQQKAREQLVPENKGRIFAILYFNKSVYLFPNWFLI